MDRIRTRLDDEADLLRSNGRALEAALRDALAHPAAAGDREELWRVAAEIAQGAARVVVLLEVLTGAEGPR